MLMDSPTERRDEANSHFSQFFLMRVELSLFFHPVVCARDKDEWSTRLTSSTEVENTLFTFLHIVV